LKTGLGRRDIAPEPDLDGEIRRRLTVAGIFPKAIKLETEWVLSAIFAPQSRTTN
jgi:hypothetical protein